MFSTGQSGSCLFKTVSPHHILNITTISVQIFSYFYHTLSLSPCCNEYRLSIQANRCSQPCYFGIWQLVKALTLTPR